MSGDTRGTLRLVVTTADEAARAVALEIAGLIREKRQLVLGLATGRTPLGIYGELARMHRDEGLDFGHVTTFNLDEYLGLDGGDERTFQSYMREHFFAPVGLGPERAWLPGSDLGPADVYAHCREYEERIADAGGIDLQILGIGRNGHIGFNEPGSTRETRTRSVALDNTTREDAADRFGALARVPRRAITMGVATILEAKQLRVLAFGKHKRDVVRRTLEDPIGPDLPATYLREHADAVLYVDRDAHPNG
jgi:glucosamine-6-phosphate deaminase